jgi:glycerol kinase
VEAMEKDSGIPLANLRVDGGMVVNELLMQFQADILQREVARPVIQETTALGAAYAAGLAVGFFGGLEELRANWAVERVWKPAMEEARREELYRQWKKAVVRSLDWVD